MTPGRPRSTAPHHHHRTSGRPVPCGAAWSTGTDPRARDGPAAPAQTCGPGTAGRDPGQTDPRRLYGRVGHRDSTRLGPCADRCLLARELREPDGAGLIDLSHLWRTESVEQLRGDHPRRREQRRGNACECVDNHCAAADHRAIEVAPARDLLGMSGRAQLLVIRERQARSEYTRLNERIAPRSAVLGSVSAHDVKALGERAEQVDVVDPPTRALAALPAKPRVVQPNACEARAVVVELYVLPSWRPLGLVDAPQRDAVRADAGTRRRVAAEEALEEGRRPEARRPALHRCNAREVDRHRAATRWNKAH